MAEYVVDTEGVDEGVNDEVESEFDDATNDVSEGAEATEQDDEGAPASDDDAGADDSPIYTIKVDGQEVDVSLDELLNGYSRQADYTRKTQELAAERQQMSTLSAFQDALTRDPQAALTALAQVYGLQSPSTQVADDPNELDPLEREVRDLRAQLSQVQQSDASRQEQARIAQITSEANAAISNHKLQGVDAESLVRFAFENQIGNLDIAAQHMTLQGRANERKVEVLKVKEGKRAAQVVSGGGNRTRGTATPPPVNSIEDAFRQAFAEHTR